MKALGRSALSLPFWRMIGSRFNGASRTAIPPKCGGAARTFKSFGRMNNKGAGVVPLMAMIRYRKASAEPVPVALLLSSRTWREVLFRDELLELERSLPNFALALALTREPTMRSSDFNRRIDATM